jgi:hypothetical protein
MSNFDLDTLQAFRKYIKKQIEQTKEDIVYGVDSTEKLQYSRGRLSALETLLQDLKDLQNKEDMFDDDNNTD